MQPLDKNTLFSIFEQGDEAVYAEYGLQGQLRNPFVLMGMVLKGIENYHIMDMMYIQKYPEQYKKVRKLTKYKYYNKLYSYLERIDSINFDAIYKIGESFNNYETEYALDHLLKYYEELEEYEKCAVIKRYVDLLASNNIRKETLI